MTAKKVRKGWVAPLEEGHGFTVEEGTPTGLYIFDDGRFGVKLTYAGVAGGDQLLLPRDRKALLALADAIRGFAGDEEHVDQ